MPRPRETLRAWLLAPVAFAVVLLTLACFEHARDWNSASRFLLTHALADAGTIEVTRYVADESGPLLHPPTRDLSLGPSGAFYSDKAPGLSFAGVLPLWIFRQATGEKPSPQTAGTRDPSDYWVTLATVGLASAGSAALIVLLGLRWGASPAWSFLAAVTSVVGTHQLVYGSMYYGHALAGFLVLASFASLPKGGGKFAPAFVAGLLSGMALAVEYTAALFAAVVVAVYLIAALAMQRGAIQTLAGFLAGHVVPLGLLALYHQEVTGSPLRVPYTMEVDPQFGFHREGVGIPIGLPTAEGLIGLWVDPDRGLLPMASLFLVGIPSLILWARRGRVGSASIVGLSSLAIYLAIAGFPNWHGGLAIGPRLLLPMFPLWMAVSSLGLTEAMRSTTGRALLVGWSFVAIVMMLQMPIISVVGQDLMGRGFHALSWPWHLEVAPRHDDHAGAWLMGPSSAALFLTSAIVNGIVLIPSLCAVAMERKVSPRSSETGTAALPSPPGPP